MEIEKMSLDYESFSDQDIRKCGAYRYWESPASRILLMGVSVNDGPVVQYDFTRGDLPPDDILRALADPKVEKWAFNASFERIASSTWLRRHRPDIFKGYGPPGDSTGNYLDPEGWKCSMVWSAYLGLPLSLDAVGHGFPIATLGGHCVERLGEHSYAAYCQQDGKGAVSGHYFLMVELAHFWSGTVMIYGGWSAICSVLSALVFNISRT